MAESAKSNSELEFAATLKEGMRRTEMFSCHCLVALSGGPDSVAMIQGLTQFRAEFDLRISAAHINHQLRGQESDDDAVWVNDLCNKLKVPMFGIKVDVKAAAHEKGIGIEEAARKARYEFLLTLAEEHGCQVIAVAHHRNDQAETVLGNFLRGSGIAGLRGMQSSRNISDQIRVVRPMLDASQASVLQYLESIGQDFRVDSTNRQNVATRNKIRNELIPKLESDFNPAIVDGMVRIAEQAREIEEIIESLVSDLMTVALKYQDNDTVRVDCNVLQGQNRHLIRALFHRIWRLQDWPRKTMTYSSWDNLASLTENAGAVTLPGNIDARRRGSLLVVTRSF